MINEGQHRIDLHIHTLYSDGLAEPSEIVKRAAELGYDTIAITDHDGAGGIKEAQSAGEQYGIRVIAGIELSVNNQKGIGNHILGYGYDPEFPEFAAAMNLLKQYRDDRNIRLLKILNSLGYKISKEELMARQPHGYIGKPIIARLLEEKGYISNYDEAFTSGEILESPQARSVKRIKLGGAEAVRLINNAGGIAVMAHPIQTKGIGQPGTEEFYTNIEELISEYKEYGLGGLECYHPDQDDTQTKRFIEIAVKHGLEITRGSDFHGQDFADAKLTAEPGKTGSPQLIQL